MIRVKRIYEPARPADGARFLVDGLWPRGVKKSTARLDGWLKEAAPSASLRRWFSHELVRWEEFQRRYFAELRNKPKAWARIIEASRRGAVTLLFGAKDSEHNNAIALSKFLEMAPRPPRRRKGTSPLSTKPE